jgi:hypothetical protein
MPPRPIPHNCERCGENRPKKFKSNRKRLCWLCQKDEKKEAEKSLGENAMSVEDETTFNENVYSYLMESLKQRRETGYA